MGKCSKCGKEKTSFVGDICFDCYHRQPLSKRVIDNANESFGQQLDEFRSLLKVQFFEGSILEIQEHMNKFFEQEKIGRDRLIEIKYLKTENEWGSKNSVMVVYA